MNRYTPVCLALLLPLLFLAVMAQPPGPVQPTDPRNIKNGSVIPDEGYSDQPYVVITNDGAWLCVMTTGSGVEGEGDDLFSRGETGADSSDVFTPLFRPYGRKAGDEVLFPGSRRLRFLFARMGRQREQGDQEEG